MAADRMMLTWETAEWADGPKLAAWLDERVQASHWGESFARAMRFWRAGRAVEFWTLDRYLTPMGFHPADLPADVWREPPQDFRKPPRARYGRRGNPNRKLSEGDVRRIRERCSNGEAIRAVARDYGLDHKTVRYIVNRRTWAHLGAA